MLRPLCRYIALSVVLLAMPLSADTITIEHRGPDLLEAATRDRFIAADAKENALRLVRSYLVTNEMGVTAKAIDVLGETGAAKIVFNVPVAGFDRALLLIYTDEKGEVGVPTSITVNGRTKPYVHDAARMLTGGWARHDIAAEDLKQGTNEIVIRGGGLFVDTFSHSGSSSRSFDGGKTFRTDALGPDGEWSGEYMVRLRVYGHAPQGQVTSAVIDPAASRRTRGISPSVAIRKLSLHADDAAPAGTRIEYAVRSGSTPAPIGRLWSDWQTIAADTPLEISGDRYVQWRAVLRSDSSSRTPVLRSVRLAIEANVTPPDGRMQVEDFQNPTIVRGSYPITWESDTPRIRYLREKYELKEAIVGADQLSRQMALREWVSRRWDTGWDHGRYNYVPPWDALELLEMKPRNLCLGMCTLYSCTYVQTAAALGFNARSVIVDHHCLAEVWSDQLGKWILQDAGPGYGPQGFPVSFAYQAEGKWLNALEVHKAYLAKSLVLAVPNKPQPVNWKASERSPTFEPSTLDGVWMGLFRRFGIPLRNNHLSQPEPAEVEHGATHFHWDGYLWWSDSLDDPKFPEYSNLSNRVGDFYGPLNQVAVDLRQHDRDTLVVGLDANAPNLARYEASIDGQAWEAVQPGFKWSLHSGDNRLRVRTVSTFGEAGRKRRFVCRNDAS